MIDLHTHILPGLDDGAQSMEEALAMARVALADGVTCLVATPHDTGFVPYDASKVKALTEQVQEAIEAEGLPLRVVAGTELYAMLDLVARLQAEESLTLGGSRYALIEFPLTDLPLCTDQLLFELRIARLRPIIARVKGPRFLAVTANRSSRTQLSAKGFSSRRGIHTITN